MPIINKLKAESMIFWFLVYLTFVLDQSTCYVDRSTLVVPLLNRMIDSVIEVVTLSRRVDAL